jgi:Zn-dependent M28 family amino/carboxypeptidase
VWGAEEPGRLGSQASVDELSQEERDRIARDMNDDMIGPPNYFFRVYDADRSTFEAPVVVPDGSEATKDVYESYCTAVGGPYDDSEFGGRSDYEAFILAAIPSGGLVTGAEVVKTPEQGAIWAAPPVSSSTPATTSYATLRRPRRPPPRIDRRELRSSPVDGAGVRRSHPGPSHGRRVTRAPCR